MKYLRGYYIVNTLLLLVYPYLKYHRYSSPKLREVDTFGYTKESGILFTGLALLFVMWRKSTTTAHFLSNIYFVGKSVTALLLLVSYLRFGLYYLLGCLFSFLFFKQPKYQGPNKQVKITTPQQFEKLILKELRPGKKYRPGEEKEYPDMNMWLVEFYADWAETCVYTKETWAEYSLKYTTENMKFGEVNLMTMPEIAEKYAISTSAVSRQLPTLILFEDGVEKQRFPPYDDKTKRYMRVLKYEKKKIAQFFDLEQRYLATRHLEKENNQPNDVKKQK